MFFQGSSTNSFSVISEPEEMPQGFCGADSTRGGTCTLTPASPQQQQRDGSTLTTLNEKGIRLPVFIAH